MSRHARGLRGRTDGWTGNGRVWQAQAAGSERRPAAGQNRGLRWRLATKIAMSRQRRSLRRRTGGRVQAIPKQSGLTACIY